MLNPNSQKIFSGIIKERNRHSGTLCWTWL